MPKSSGRELRPEDVLADLFGSDDFPGEVFDTVEAARVVLRRLEDAGFVILPAAGRDWP
jgi:hypothetical protein